MSLHAWLSLWTIALGVSAGATPLIGTASSSFSCAISTITLRSGDAPYEVCTISAANTSGGIVSTQWITGTFGAVGEGMEATLISIYVDNEVSPSLTFFPYELTGIPSLAAWNSTHAEEQPPWQSPVWARNSGTSFTNTIPIPFVTSLKITLTFTGAAGKSAVLYYQAHGRLLSLIDGFSFGGVELPISARLVVQRNDLVLPRLAYLPIVNVSAGSAALIAAMAIAFSAPNLNTLEGCFHSYVTAATSYPGELHSTGTEDEFLSSYYFDMGPFQGRGAGVYYKRSSPAALSMWRSYYDDPMILNDGGAFVWRNGDTSDPVTGIKCSIQTGGSPAGDPQDANVQTMAFVYVVANT